MPRNMNCCCVTSLLCVVLQEQCRPWLTGCQREAGSSWSRVHITSLSCSSTSLLPWFSEACLKHGGLSSVMSSLTSHWQHSSVMTFTSVNMSHTHRGGKHSYLLCFEELWTLYLVMHSVLGTAEKRPSEELNVLVKNSAPSQCWLTRCLGLCGTAQAQQDCDGSKLTGGAGLQDPPPLVSCFFSCCEETRSLTTEWQFSATRLISS